MSVVKLLSDWSAVLHRGWQERSTDLGPCMHVQDAEHAARRQRQRLTRKVEYPLIWDQRLLGALYGVPEEERVARFSAEALAAAAALAMASFCATAAVFSTVLALSGFNADSTMSGASRGFSAMLLPLLLPLPLGECTVSGCSSVAAPSPPTTPLFEVTGLVLRTSVITAC